MPTGNYTLLAKSHLGATLSLYELLDLFVGLKMIMSTTSKFLALASLLSSSSFQMCTCILFRLLVYRPKFAPAAAVSDS